MCFACTSSAGALCDISHHPRRKALIWLAAAILSAACPVPNAQAGNPNKATAEWLWQKYGKMYYPDTRQGALEWLAKHHLADVDGGDPRWRYLPHELTRTEVDNYAMHLKR